MVELKQVVPIPPIIENPVSVNNFNTCMSFILQSQLNEVLDAMFERKTQPGEHVIDQGDDGDNFYVIDK